MDITSFVANLLVLVGIILVYTFQKRQIESLQTSIKGQQDVLSAIKTYFDIFKIDELKKYVALKDENTLLESRKKIQEVTAITEQESKRIQKTVKMMEEENSELVSILWGLLFLVPPHMREQRIRTFGKGPVTEQIVKNLPSVADTYVPITLLDMALANKASENPLNQAYEEAKRSGDLK